jgi:2-alkyl-3-oxoalkanoate reductase
VRADLRDPLAVQALVEGVDAVIHVAALASDWGSLETFRKENVEPSLTLARAAQAAGARQFVYVSSSSVHGFGDHVDTTEEGPYFPLKYHYPMTKMEAERAVLALNAPDFAVKAIRPCNVYGPGDTTSTYIMFDHILSGSMGYLGKGDKLTCPVYIDDLCSGIRGALDCEALAGKAMLLGDGDRVSWREYTERMFEVAGVGKKPLRLPGWVAYAFAWLSEKFCLLFRAKGQPLLTLYLVEQTLTNYSFKPELARRLVGFEPKVFYKEGLARTFEAYSEARKSGSRSGASSRGSRA